MDCNNPLLATPVTMPLAKHRAANRGFQGIPGFSISPGGRFFACWYGGGPGECAENYVIVRVSDDQGKNWRDVAVVDPPGENIRAFDPTLWTDPLGRVWLFWTQSFSPKQNVISDGVNGVWAAYLEATEAENLSWSAPMRIADGVMLNKPFVMPDGGWGYPVSVWAPGVGGGTPPEWLQPHVGAGLVVSYDQGKSYLFRSSVRLEKSIFDEHHIVPLKDGRFWCLARTTYGAGQAFSSDGGFTWEGNGPASFGGPNSRFFIRRLASGMLLLVNHDNVSKGDGYRTRAWLTAYLSEDDGATWPWKMLLDARAEVSYPDACQDQAGDIWCIYDWRRYAQGQILLAHFREEDIVAGTPLVLEKHLVVGQLAY